MTEYELLALPIGAELYFGIWDVDCTEGRCELLGVESVDGCVYASVSPLDVTRGDIGQHGFALGVLSLCCFELFLSVRDRAFHFACLSASCGGAA